MWKQKPDNVSSPLAVPTSQPARSQSSAAEPRPPATAGVDRATIAKGIVISGEISGTDPLFVDGTVEGSIHIPGQRVTIGQNGNVVAAKDLAGPCITAREIVILGTVTGSVLASDRLDLRAQATLAGDVITARISIEDGAYFRGGIDIRQEQPTPAAQSAEKQQPAEAVQV